MKQREVKEQSDPCRSLGPVAENAGQRVLRNGCVGLEDPISLEKIEYGDAAVCGLQSCYKLENIYRWIQNAPRPTDPLTRGLFSDAQIRKMKNYYDVMQNARESGYLLNDIREGMYGLQPDLKQVEFTDDDAVVLAAVKKRGGELEYASQRLRGDRRIVLTAVKNDPTALKYASPQLKNDREFVLAAVKQNGHSLKYAPPQLKNDRDIVMAALFAVRYMGDVLQYASYQLQNDRSLVMMAVKQDPEALEFASKQLKDDFGIVMAAVKKSKRAIPHASDRLRTLFTVMLASIRSAANAKIERPND